MGDKLAIDTVIRWLSGCQLPKDDAEAEHVSLLGVFVAVDDFRRHPLVRTNFGGHDFGFDSRPAEVCQLAVQGVVKQDIQALQVSVENGLLVGVQIVHTLCNIQGKLLAVFPGHLDLSIVKQTPERSSGAVLKDDAEIWCLCACSQEKDDIWMPDDLHHSALILELLELVLLDDLLLDFLDGHGGVLPPASVYDTIATFRQLSVIVQLVEWDLIILVEDSVLIHHVHEALVLIHDASSDLLLDVLSVCPRLLKLAEHLPLVLREHTDGLLLLLAEALFQVFAFILIAHSFLRFAARLHDQLLAQALDLGLQLLHLLQIWAVVLSVLVDDHLLVFALLLSSTGIAGQAI